MQAKFQLLLSGVFLERQEIIDTTLAALLAGEHVLFLGPPGTGKSMLARAIADTIDGSRYFEWLLTRFSTPEELYGPISLQSLQNDSYRRISTGKLPEAHIAFLDEIFKASSAILNSLLSIINERRYHNDGSSCPVPLLSLLAASNELPQAEDLSALYDRFLCKFWISYVCEGSFRSLLTLPGTAITPLITLKELREAQRDTQAVKVSPGTLDALEKLRDALASDGIQMSDRKWRHSLKLLKAVAYLAGQDETSPENIETLKHVAWSDPNDRGKVARIVACVSNPLGAALLDIEDGAREIYDSTIKASTPEAGAEANQKLKHLQQQLESLLAKNPAHRLKIESIKVKIQGMNHRIIKDILGLDI